ncbi:sensor histidine kinase [uncultured Paraglaciecola sp.]|uniref:sensor histidine kinase n=1 Tax=uncultured Paraglaciecola sp. TaxID=1765024 RepID=UPI0026148164|nr:histidine kinase [uncultured Paraglaciecola sp.]
MSFAKLTNTLWKWQVMGWLVYFVLMFLTFLTRETSESLSYIFVIKSFRTLIGFLLSCLLWLIYQRLINSQSISKMILIIALCSAFFGIVWTALETTLFWLTLADYDLLHSLQFKPRVALTYTVTLMAWSAIYFGVTYWKQAQVEHQNTLQAKILAETAQLDMLRYQVNPHFLFNALNSVRALIHPDNPAAKQMITQLSEFLRHSLMSDKKSQNSLAEELQAIENYLAIEKVRFEDALDITFDIDESAKNVMLPSFLLNPLVENAIKHGFKTSTDVLTVIISAKLTADRLFIEVKNSGKLTPSNTNKNSHIGLNNVQQRLEKQFPNQSSFLLHEANGMVIAGIEVALK